MRLFKKKIPLYTQILIAMLLGVTVGWVAGNSAAPLGEIGKVIIQLIKTLAAPLLFLAVVDAFLRTHVTARSGLIMVTISLINAVLALVIGLSVSNWLRPGDHLEMPALSVGSVTSSITAERMDWIKTVSGYVPSSIVQPFLENSVITIILMAVLLGLAFRHVKNEQLREGSTEYLVIENGVLFGFRAVEKLLGWVVAWIPLAVFGVVAKTVGAQGFAPLKGLAAYVGTALIGLLFHILVVYQSWIVFGARMKLARFWSGAREAVIYALGASSSLATLPVTLKSLDQMGVSTQSARLAACVGTNLNNDDILLYEAMAVLFVAQVYHLDLTLSQQVIAALSCMVAGIGIAGVPDAGLISLSLVLATVGLPIEILPLLLTVDWILSRARATTNVISDFVVSILLDRFSAPDHGEQQGKLASEV